MRSFPVLDRIVCVVLVFIGTGCGSPAAEPSSAPASVVAPVPATSVVAPAPVEIEALPPASPAVPPPPGLVAVRGRVVDESGAPIAGATIAVSSEEYARPPCTTDASGAFSTNVPPTPALRLAASHPDYGDQWTDMLWQSWSRYDVITAEPVQLTLRRGVVLEGRLLDPSGQPRAHETLLLIPAYVGSGPRPLETSTDGDGHFTYERAVLHDFELVARSLDDWHPETVGHAGEYLRIVPHAAEWIADAQAGRALSIVVEPLTLVAVTFRMARANAPAARQNIDLWLRGGPSGYVGTMPRTDAQGRVTTVMERGVAYEVWASLDHGERTIPWTEGIAPSWQGSIDAPTEIALTIP